MNFPIHKSKDMLKNKDKILSINLLIETTAIQRII